MKELGNVFILGDSYSTFEGYNPEGYDVWYNNEPKEYNDLCRVEDCWWHRFFEKAPATLVRNCSYSGTTRHGYPLAGERLCPAPFLYIKEGVGEKASAPSMQAKSQRLVGMSRRRRSSRIFVARRKNSKRASNVLSILKKNYHKKSDCPPKSPPR